jgi:hypothetical protein
MLIPPRAKPITPAEEVVWRNECAPEEGFVEYSYADVRRLFATIDQAREKVTLLRSVLEEVDPFVLSAGDLCSKKDILDACRQRSLIDNALDDTK